MFPNSFEIAFFGIWGLAIGFGFKGGGDTRSNDGAANGFGIGRPGDPYPTLGKSDIHSCYTRGAVRRITPKECERLQGFPDDYTLIPLPLKGNRKKQRYSSDSARYKALGNSMAVPVMRWIGERIQKIEQIKGKLCTEVILSL